MAAWALILVPALVRAADFVFPSLGAADAIASDIGRLPKGPYADRRLLHGNEGYIAARAALALSSAAA